MSNYLTPEQVSKIKNSIDEALDDISLSVTGIEHDLYQNMFHISAVVKDKPDPPSDDCMF